MTIHDRTRNVVVVFGDQLDPDSAAFDDFDSAHDVVVMTEASEEATYIPQHRQRLILFFSAMRHMRDELRRLDRRVLYSELEDPSNTGSLSDELMRRLETLQPERIIALEPGDYRVQGELKAVAARTNTPLELRTDTHFLDTRAGFADFAEQRRTLRLEHYYRGLRKRYGILMDGTQPEGGRWNFDADNRAALNRTARGKLTPQARVPRTPAVEDVMAMVARQIGRAHV